MRQGQQNRRGRGRGTSSSNNSSNTNNRKAQNPLSRSFESNGPDVKIRGTAAQIAEKYMTLARDASSSGDTIMSENYFQHAEHYNRIIMAAQQAQTVQNAQPAAHNGSDASHTMNGAQRPQRDGNSSGMREQPQPHSDPQPRSEAQPQPQPQPFAAQADQPPEEQPQPAPKAEPAEEAQDGESGGKNAAGAEASAEGADTGRRRRRRYPGGADAGNAPTAEKKPSTRKSTKAAPASNEDQPTDEATA
ncbi:MAG: DUF4167 domain-containing protein [Rhodomicrobiaceae bacterium]